MRTFLIAWHLAVSEKPIIFSGEQILMNGKFDSSEILAASAVLPLCGGPVKGQTGVSRITLIDISIRDHEPHLQTDFNIPTFKKNTNKGCSVTVLCLLDKQLPVLQDTGHWVSPLNDAIHNVACIVFLVSSKGLKRCDTTVCHLTYYRNSMAQQANKQGFNYLDGDHSEGPVSAVKRKLLTGFISFSRDVKKSTLVTCRRSAFSMSTSTLVVAYEEKGHL